jgi:hypothetical protein
MASVDRFRQAEEDLLSIAAFIARDKPLAAGSMKSRRNSYY